jgi:hypothetical protein
MTTELHPTRAAAEASLIAAGWCRNDEQTFGHGRALACVEAAEGGFILRIWRRT